MRYKFLRVKSKMSDQEINDLINKLGEEGWDLLNFHPTSEAELSKTGPFHNVEPWDAGYVFVFKQSS